MAKKLHLKDFILRSLFLTVPFSNPAYAATNEFTYQVYAGGLHAVEAKLTFSTNPQQNAYDINLDAYTRGWLNSLVPWQGSFQTIGHADQDTFIPKTHQSKSIWKGEAESKTFAYEKRNLVRLTLEEEGVKTDITKLDQSLTEETTDILSATFNVMNHTLESGKCSGESDVFDGKRRFTLFFRDKGEDVLTPSKYNIASGPARICIVEIEPKGGQWHKKPRGWLSIQEQGRQKGTLPSVWMGQVPGFNYAVPVKIKVKTNYGTLLMHLTNVNQT